MNPIKLFISYSHNDELLKDKIVKQLASLKRKGAISIWDDRAIDAGKEWKKEIDEQLKDAAIILMLISEDFISSDFCHEIEMKKALERHDAGEAIVIPIILRDCDWEIAEFAKLQALPGKGALVTQGIPSDEAFAHVAREIRRVVERLQSNP